MKIEANKVKIGSAIDAWRERTEESERHSLLWSSEVTIRGRIRVLTCTALSGISTLAHFWMVT